MRVRFFSDWGPNDTVRVLVGISPDDPDRGEEREAVHVATQADIDAYPAAYAEYEKTVEAAKSAVPAETSASAGATGQAAAGSGAERHPAPAGAEAATSVSRSSGGGGGSSRSGGSSSGSSGASSEH